MKRRLLIYAHQWAPTVGGVQTVTMDLARGICDWSNAHPDEAWEITLATNSSAEGMDDSALAFRVVRQPSVLQLLHLIRSTEIVHVAGPALLPLALGWLLRKRVVVVHHGYQSICPNGLLLFGVRHELCPGHFMAKRYWKCVQCNSQRLGLWRSLRDTLLEFPRRWLTRHSTANVAVSRHVGNRIELPRTRVIYNGVPIDDKLRIVAPNSSKCDVPTFAFVGRLVAEKGLPVLLQASSKLVREKIAFRVEILGDGPERGVLQKLSQDLGLQERVNFHGSVPKDDISAQLASALAVIMPSVCEDVAPLVLLEQMRDGRLVIGSDIGGLGEFLDGVGLKFPSGDSEALAEVMRRVLNDPEGAVDMGVAARGAVRRIFSAERMVREHVSLYNDLLWDPREQGHFHSDSTDDKQTDRS